LIREGDDWKINNVIDADITMKFLSKPKKLFRQNWPEGTPVRTVQDFYRLWLMYVDDFGPRSEPPIGKYLTDRCLDYANLNCLYEWDHFAVDEKKFSNY
jgi:hypothetical protein